MIDQSKSGFYLNNYKCRVKPQTYCLIKNMYLQYSKMEIKNIKILYK